eukprot:13720951-Alexandrium_andersonii.AAC.1
MGPPEETLEVLLELWVTLEVSLKARAQQISEEGGSGENCSSPEGISHATHANVFLGSTDLAFGGVPSTPEVDLPLHHQLLPGEPGHCMRWLARLAGEARKFLAPSGDNLPCEREAELPGVRRRRLGVVAAAG